MSFSDSTLYIDLAALAANYKTISAKAKAAETAAVVKANGYGLGVEQVSKTLAKAGCKKFFAATLDEAIELRSILSPHSPTLSPRRMTGSGSRHEDGMTPEIFVFQGIRPGQEKIFLQNKITPILNELGEIKVWEKFCRSKNSNLPAGLHVDTGMNRLGLSFKEAENLNTKLNIKYLLSHLACADEPEHPLNKEQLKKFNRIRKIFPQAVKSLANSSGVFLADCYHFDLTRPGISLYGGSPDIQKKNPVKPVISLKTKVIGIREIDSRQTVGYGATAIVPKGSKLAVVPIGYADGILRSLSNSGEVFINGKKVKVVGRVSMDLLIIDVSKIPGAKIGSEVELIGKNITIDDIAKQAGTISYEILTRLGQRFNRVYLEK